MFGVLEKKKNPQGSCGLSGQERVVSPRPVDGLLEEEEVINSSNADGPLASWLWSPGVSNVEAHR